MIQTVDDVSISHAADRGRGPMERRMQRPDFPSHERSGGSSVHVGARPAGFCIFFVSGAFPICSKVQPGVRDLTSLHFLDFSSDKVTTTDRHSSIRAPFMYRLTGNCSPPDTPESAVILGNQSSSTRIS